jgi:nitrilase
VAALRHKQPFENWKSLIDIMGSIADDAFVPPFGAPARIPIPPFARYSLLAQAEQIHISSWPPLWPTRRPGKGGNFNNVAANRIRSSAHSFEAKAFGINTAGYMDAAMREFLVTRDPRVANIVDRAQRAASFFVDPTGETVGDTLQDQEGIAYAEFDLRRCVEPKQVHDVAGYYNRFDVFSLTVNRKRHCPVTFVNVEELAFPSMDEMQLGEEAGPRH